MTIAQDILTDRAGWEIADDVRLGTVSAAAVTEHFIRRIDHLNPALRAFVHLDHDYWRRQAAAVDARTDKGPLAGVPIGIKDIFNTEVFPTEMGSPIWSGHKAGNDSRCVSYLRRDGAVLAGKTDTAEFAVHAPNKVVNPWNRHHVPGTSSGGSAAAVAAGMVPMALGTQTAGSVIRPASWCGVYAMKPSFGLIPRTGVLKTTDTLDNIGFFGRDARDLEVLLDVLRVRGANYPGREELLTARGSAGHRWRVGFFKGPKWDTMEPYVRSAMEGLVSTLRAVAGVDLVDIELPSAAKAHALHRRVYNPCLAYYFRDEIEKAPEHISDTFMRLVADGRSIPPADYREALHEQEVLAGELDQAMSQVDVLLHPSSNGSAPIASEPDEHQDMNLLWTLAWLPVVNVPHFTGPSGLPFGFQAVGRRYSDYRLLTFLRSLVQAGVTQRVARLAVPAHPE